MPIPAFDLRIAVSGRPRVRRVLLDNSPGTGGVRKERGTERTVRNKLPLALHARGYAGCPRFGIDDEDLTKTSRPQRQQRGGFVRELRGSPTCGAPMIPGAARSFVIFFVVVEAVMVAGASPPHRIRSARRRDGARTSARPRGRAAHGDREPAFSESQRRADHFISFVTSV